MRADTAEWVKKAEADFVSMTREMNAAKDLNYDLVCFLMNPVRKGLCERPEDWVWIYRPNDRPPPQW